MQRESPWSRRTHDCDQPRRGWQWGQRGTRRKEIPTEGGSESRVQSRRLPGRGARDEDPELTQEIEQPLPVTPRPPVPSPAVTLTTATSGDMLNRLPNSPAREQPCLEWPRGATPLEGQRRAGPRHPQLSAVLPTGPLLPRKASDDRPSQDGQGRMTRTGDRCSLHAPEGPRAATQGWQNRGWVGQGACQLGDESCAAWTPRPPAPERRCLCISDSTLPFVPRNPRDPRTGPRNPLQLGALPNTRPNALLPAGPPHGARCPLARGS